MCFDMIKLLQNTESGIKYSYKKSPPFFFLPEKGKMSFKKFAIFSILIWSTEKVSYIYSWKYNYSIIVYYFDLIEKYLCIYFLHYEISVPISNEISGYIRFL